MGMPCEHMQTRSSGGLGIQKVPEGEMQLFMGNSRLTHLVQQHQASGRHQHSNPSDSPYRGPFTLQGAARPGSGAAMWMHLHPWMSMAVLRQLPSLSLFGSVSGQQSRTWSEHLEP